MIRIAVFAGLAIILVAVGALGLRLYQAKAEALELIRLGDQHFRGGHYLKALETYQRSHARQGSPHAEGRIRLAQETLRAQRAPLRPATPAAASPAVLPAPAPPPGSGSAAPPPAGPPGRQALPGGQQQESHRKAAETVRTLLREGRFDEVEARVSQLLAEKRLTPNGYLYAASLLNHSVSATDTWQNKADLLPRLDLWVQERPASSLALTFRGAFHNGAAWHARGQGWASSVTERGWTAMREHLAHAARDLEAAHTSDARNPLPSILMASAARPMGADLPTLDLHVRRALEYDARPYEPYLFKLEYLKPKWRGSEAAMFAFARESLASAPQGSAAPRLLAEAHSEKGEYLAGSDRQYLNTPEVWAEIQGVHKQIERDFPRSTLWPTEYAQLAKRAGRLEEAQRHFDLALARDPADFDVRYERGVFFEEIVADVPKALDEYAEAARLEPFSSKAHYKLGSMQVRTGQWPKAIATYTVLIGLEPEDARLYYTRARGYYMERRYQDAVQDLSQAIALKPDYRDAYRARAACYERLGMPDKQQADLRAFQSLPQ